MHTLVLLQGLASCESSRTFQLKKCMIKSAQILQEAYPTDLEVSLSDELLQFSGFLNTDFVKKSLEVTTASVPATSSVPSTIDSDDEAVITKDDDDVRLNVDSLELRMYRQASCPQNSGNCISEHCYHIPYLSHSVFISV